MQQAVQRESKQTRQTAGILDGSTLGKIEIKGRDALKFMNLMYTNAFTKMKPMTARYALMLGEDGMIMDDGIVCKISDQHFIATTTSSGAPEVYHIWKNFFKLNGHIYKYILIRLPSNSPHLILADQKQRNNEQGFHRYKF